MDFIDFFADKPEGRSIAKQIVEDFLKGEIILNRILRMESRAGDSVWISLSVEPVRDSNGKITEGRSVFWDTSRQKALESELREKESRIRSLIESNADALIVVDNHGVVRLVNKAAEYLLNTTRDRLIGEKFGFPFVESETTEIEILGRKGDTCCAEMRVAETSWGRETVYIASLRDITIRKKMEDALEESSKRYKMILQSIEDGYYETDLNGNYIFFNESMSKITGFSMDELSQKNFSALTDDETGVRLKKTFNGVYKTGAPQRRLEHRMKKKDGSTIFVEASASLVIDQHGNPMGFRGVIRDVTDRKNLETQLFQSQKLEAIGVLAGGVAHDFNNFLTTILGNTHIMLSEIEKDRPLQRGPGGDQAGR